MSKYIFITGGVVSSLGKGIVAASLGAILEARKLSVTILKLDPYLNIDPGTMSPYQHGEVFVTEDGAETDLDLGHYERFIQTKLSSRNNFTSGKVYETILRTERIGEFEGGTVQVIPHVTDEIKRRIKYYDGKYDIIIIEIGGTVGDIESLPFLETIRQLFLELPRENYLLVHLTYLPYIKSAGEIKTKPTQHAVRDLRMTGLQPDFLVCRSAKKVDDKTLKKISLLTSVAVADVIPIEDVISIYQIPELLHQYHFDAKITHKLAIHDKPHTDLSKWIEFNNKYRNSNQTIQLAMVGKYTDYTDSYKSLNEALLHAAVNLKIKINIDHIDAETIEAGKPNPLANYQAIVIPGGFGTRGIEGKLEAIRYARINNIPFLGICLGMQLAVIEYLRNVAGYPQADSTEFNEKTTMPVISLVTEWIDQHGIKAVRTKSSPKGGTMRLGAQECHLQPNSRAATIYNKPIIYERHRHRYELNGEYLSKFTDTNFIICGKSKDGMLVEMIELNNHRWFIGCQFHPEFLSKPFMPHPLIYDFIKTASDQQT